MTNLPAPTKQMQLGDLWRADGTIGRGPYLLWGTSLFGIKYGIDSLVADLIFHQHWDFLRYLFPGQSLDFLLLNSADRLFYITIMVLALPFIWAGVVLTIRRLRSAGLPVFLVYLFFVPFVNLLMFIVLSTMPTLKTISPPATSKPKELSTDAEHVDLPAPIEAAPGVIPPLPNWPKPDRSLPVQDQLVLNRHAHKRADLVRTLAITCPAAIVAAWLGIFGLQSYGWGMFVGLPFVLGMMSAYLYGSLERKTFGDSVGIAMLATTLLGVGMFFFAWEGMACLAMASPIVYALAFMGAVLGHNIQKNKLRPQDRRLLMAALVLGMPTLMGAEFAVHPQAALIGVRTVLDIKAPPSVVWRNVIAFPQLEPPDDPLFKLGIAYPVGATISGEGVGAIRKCNFSTGAFIEPIKVWDAPRLLKFGVEAQPPSMREFSWNHEIHPAHLQGYLNVHGGQFELQPLGANGTRLIGTTWYQNKMWPAPYWRLWSDEIIHRIHLRVLKHIRRNSEQGADAFTVPS